MKKLTDSEFQALSEISGAPYDVLSVLYAQNLLHVPTVFAMLIKADYARIKGIGNYKAEQIITALSAKYQVSRSYIRNAAFGRTQKKQYCIECGHEISSDEYTRGKGLCKSCVTKHIQQL